MLSDRDTIAARLARTPVRDPGRTLADRRAAVAAVLRVDGPEGLSVLLMQRAESERDRWSGQISMPGGREDDLDADLHATAVRETREELGLDLTSAARLVGRLPYVHAVARGRILPMTISPFVFTLEGPPPPLRLSDEATAAFWLPLGRAADGSLDDRHEIRLGPLPMRFPAWRYDGRVVWGLTYQMLRSLLAALEP